MNSRLTVIQAIFPQRGERLEHLIRQQVEDGYRRGWRDGRKALAAKMEGDPYFSMESALCEAAPSLFGTDYAYFADIGMDGGGGSPPDFD